MTGTDFENMPSRSLALAVRRLTLAAQHLQVRVAPVIRDETVVLTGQERTALIRALQQRDPSSIDVGHARRLLTLNKPLTLVETIQLAVDIDRVITAAQRADKLRRGQIPGALSSKEVSDLARRGFLR